MNIPLQHGAFAHRTTTRKEQEMNPISSTKKAVEVRKETDSLGDVDVPRARAGNRINSSPVDGLAPGNRTAGACSRELAQFSN